MLAVIFLSLVVDLGLFSKSTSNNQTTLKSSLLRSLAWFGLGLLSVVTVYFLHPTIHNITDFKDLYDYQTKYGSHFLITNNLEESIQHFKLSSATAYLSGFLLEYALSIDNLFVMLLVFQSFKISHENEKKILVWGILGAMILRFVFIYLGSNAIHQFHWVLYFFGGLLIFSGFKLMFQKSEEHVNTENHIIYRICKRLFSLKDSESHPHAFFYRENGKLFVTTLFVVLLIIEFTDVIFAIDSVPAVFGVTTDPYLVFFSNIFALIGLRSLYFLIGFGIDKFYALKYGLSIILVYIGAKMLLEEYAVRMGFTHLHNLLIIIGILAISVFYSLKFPNQGVEQTND
jgi:tellurite resistance protein TerC